MGSAAPAVVFRVVLLVLLTPFYVRLYRTTRLGPGHGLVVAVFSAIAVSFAIDLVGTVAPGPLVDALAHATIGTAGVLAMLAMVRERSAVARGRDAR